MRSLSLFLLATCILLCGCDRAQQAALALSGTPSPTHQSSTGQAEGKPSAATNDDTPMLEIGEWLEIAGQRNKRVLVSLHAAEPMPEARLQLASAMATEINDCAQERARRQAPGVDRTIKQSMFEWAERQCARHVINQALLISGAVRAKELSDLAAMLDPSWPIPIASPPA